MLHNTHPYATGSRIHKRYYGQILKLHLQASINWKPLNMKSFPLPTRALMLAWRKLISQSVQDHLQHHIRLPLRSLELLIPCIALQQWDEAGIHWINYLYQSNQLKSFESLQAEYDHPKSAYYSYMRVSSFLSKHAPPSLQISSKIWKFLCSLHPTQKGISLFYNSLQHKLIFSKTLPMLKWEDLHTSFPETQRIRAIRCNYTLTHCVAHWEQSQKLLTRWYPTPFQNFPSPILFSVGGDVNKWVISFTPFGHAETSLASGRKYSPSSQKQGF